MGCRRLRPPEAEPRPLHSGRQDETAVSTNRRSLQYELGAAPKGAAGQAACQLPAPVLGGTQRGPALPAAPAPAC